MTSSAGTPAAVSARCQEPFQRHALMSPPEHLDLGLVGGAEQLQRFIGTAGAGPDQPGRPVVIGPDRESHIAERSPQHTPILGQTRSVREQEAVGGLTRG